MTYFAGLTKLSKCPLDDHTTRFHLSTLSNNKTTAFFIWEADLKLSYQTTSPTARPHYGQLDGMLVCVCVREKERGIMCISIISTVFRSDKYGQIKFRGPTIRSSQQEEQMAA